MEEKQAQRRRRERNVAGALIAVQLAGVAMAIERPRQHANVVPQPAMLAQPRRMTIRKEQLLDEIEDLRLAHGVRITAAVALVAERHGIDEMALAIEHFDWRLGESNPEDVWLPFS